MVISRSEIFDKKFQAQLERDRKMIKKIKLNIFKMKMEMYENYYSR